jgi:uncharacterized protein (TIGR03067 family)
MVRFTLFVALACSGLAAPPPQLSGKANRKELEGKWRLVALEQGGKKQPEAGVKARNQYLFVQGKAFHIKREGKTRIAGTIESETLTVPKQVTFDAVDLQYKGRLRLEAIYQLQSDRLTICVPDFGHPRPTTFITTGKRDVQVEVYLRVTK